MKKLLFILYWLVMVYSGDSGRRTFQTAEKPQFIHDGRWIQFVDVNGRDVHVSSGSTIIFYESND